MAVLSFNAVIRGFSITISIGKIIYTTDDDICIALLLYQRNSTANDLDPDAGELEFLDIYGAQISA